MLAAARRAVVPVLVLSVLVMSACCSFRAGAVAFGQGRADGRRTKTVVGSGRLRTEARMVRGVHALRLVAPVSVHVVQGDKESLRIQADDNILPLITTECENGVLVVGLRQDLANTVRPTRPIKLNLVVRELSEIDIPGAGEVESPGLRAKAFSVSIAGSGSVKLNVGAEQTRIDIPGSGAVTMKLNSAETRVGIPGSGNCQLAGMTDRLWVEIGSSGKCAAAGLASREAHVSVSGSGEVEVFAHKTLDASITGAGSILYAGEATVTSRVTGIGTIGPLPRGPAPKKR
jgi:hypothetical protein